LIQGRNHFVALRHGETATKAEIVLHVDDDQSLFLLVRHTKTLAQVRVKGKMEIADIGWDSQSVEGYRTPKL
jgi:hypothetical protein